jgi:D-xylose transport system ATP-binding protein
MSSQPILRMRGISKRYGGVQALSGVDLDIHLGEVHALVGDNAAGKSSLIKTLSGAVLKDEGEIFFEERPVSISSPRDAKALGIETVYQELALADNLNVASNIFLGRELTRGGLLRWWLDLAAMESRARAVLEKFKIHIPNIRQQVRFMSGGQRQSIAIARCVCFNARVVILDEPTAALGVEETKKVYQLVREMREHGLGVLLISHNLNQVFDHSDRITVMKNGRRVGSRSVRETSYDEILRMIVTGSPEIPAPPARAVAA